MIIVNTSGIFLLHFRIKFDLIQLNNSLTYYGLLYFRHYMFKFYNCIKKVICL